MFKNKELDPFNNDYFLKSLEYKKKLFVQDPIGKFLDFEILEKRSGGMSEILIARKIDMETGEIKLSTLKILKKDIDSLDNNISPISNELTALLKHRMTNCIWVENVIKRIDENFFGYDMSYPKKQNDDIWVIELPFCSGGSLRDRMNSNKISVNDTIFYLLNILLGLFYIHKNEWIHKDIKPDNILFYHRTVMEPKWSILISDFGISDPLEPVNKNSIFAGSLGYCAPEQLSGRNIDTSADIWAWGVIAWELISNHHPFETVFEYLTKGGTVNEYLNYVYKYNLPNEPIYYDKSIGWLMNTVRCCLDLKSTNRPTVQEVIKIFEHKCCFIDSTLKRWVGQHPEITKHLFKDYGQIPTLHARLKWIASGDFHSYVLSGWVRGLKRVENLALLNGEKENREGLKIIDSILGEWSDDHSILGQFKIDPNKKLYDYPIIEDYENTEDMLELNIAIPVELINHFLDLRIRILIHLVETYAITNDFLALKTNLLHWQDGHLSNDVHWLCRCCQAAMIVGEFEIAKNLLNYMKNQYADHSLMLDTLIKYYEIREMHKDACHLLMHQTLKAIKSGDNNSVRHFIALITMTLIEDKDYEMAFEISTNVNNKDCTIMMLNTIASFKIGKYIDKQLVNNIFEILCQQNPNTIGFRNVMHIIHFFKIIGQKQLCHEWAQVCLSSPIIALPHNKRFLTFFNNIED